MTERPGAEKRDLRVLLEFGSLADLSDGELLERCVSSPGRWAEAAFETLIVRHGVMVLDVCRRVLRDPHDAEDAFQATFLVLASRARTIRNRDSLASWLHGVALRVSANAQRARHRRQFHERRAARLDDRSLANPDSQDLSRVVVEELSRLPDQFRAAVILCDLEGLSHEDAAHRLGCPPGTIKSRQARGRQRLKSLLARRGLTPSLILLGLSSLDRPALAAVPTTLGELATKAASRMARGETVTRIGSSTVAALTKGTLTAMFLTRCKLISGLALLVSVSTLGMGMIVRASILEPPRSAPFIAQEPAPQAKPVQEILQEAALSIPPEGEPAARCFALTEIAKAQARSGDRPGALETIRRAMEAAKLVDEPNRRATALMTVAWTCHAPGELEVKAETIRQVRDILEGIIRNGQPMEYWPRLFAAILDESGDRPGAAEVANQFRKQLDRIPQPSERLSASMSLAGLYAYLGNYQAAFDLVESDGRGDDFARGRIFGVIADYAASPAMYSNQPRRKVKPEERQAALDALKKIDTLTRDLEFADQRPDVHIATNFCRLGDPESARRACDRFAKGPLKYPHTIDQTARPYLLGVIGGSWAKLGKTEESRQCFEEAINQVEHDPKLATPIGQSRLSQIAGFQVDAGDIAGALKLSQKIPPESRTTLLISMADQRAAAGDREGSLSFLKRASDEISGLTEQKPSGPNDSEKALLLKIRVKQGDFAGALEILDSIQKEDRKAWSAQEIAKARASAGEAEATLKWALSIKQSTTRLFALRGLAEGIPPISP